MMVVSPSACLNVTARRAFPPVSVTIYTENERAAKVILPFTGLTVVTNSRPSAPSCQTSSSCPSVKRGSVMESVAGCPAWGCHGCPSLVIVMS